MARVLLFALVDADRQRRCSSASRRRCGWPRTDMQDAHERERPLGDAAAAAPRAG